MCVFHLIFFADPPAGRGGMRRGQGRDSQVIEIVEENRKEKESSSSEDETKIVRRKRAGDKFKRGVKESTKTKKAKRDTDSDDDDDADDAKGLSVTFKSDRQSVKEGSRDMGATSTAQYDTEHDRDALAIAERALAAQKELGGKEDDKIYRGMNNYAQYFEKKDSIMGNAAKSMNKYGPIRAPSNIRSTVRWDYAPDICKDFKETGFCGFGDSCKFMHDRGDYKHGWQLEIEERNNTYGKSDDDPGKYEIADSDDDDDLPFKCYLCRKSFKNPIVTKCKHYFCESCALGHHRKNKRCFVCGESTGGIFNPAKDLVAKLEKREKEGKAGSGDDDDDDGGGDDDDDEEEEDD